MTRCLCMLCGRFRDLTVSIEKNKRNLNRFKNIAFNFRKKQVVRTAVPNGYGNMGSLFIMF